MVEKHSANITLLSKRQPFPLLVSSPSSVEHRPGEADTLTPSLLLPRLGLLVVFLPPRILKKPFPNDERAFLEPKLSSSMLAGKVADGPMGGFSPALLISSLVFWKREIYKCLCCVYFLSYKNVMESRCVYFTLLMQFLMRRQSGERMKINQFLHFYLFIITPFQLVLSVILQGIWPVWMRGEKKTQFMMWRFRLA